MAPIGHDRDEAQALAARLAAPRETPPPATGGPITLGVFLTETWLPQKRRHVLGVLAARRFQASPTTAGDQRARTTHEAEPSQMPSSRRWFSKTVRSVARSRSSRCRSGSKMRYPVGRSRR